MTPNASVRTLEPAPARRAGPGAAPGGQLTTADAASPAGFAFEIADSRRRVSQDGVLGRDTRRDAATSKSGAFTSWTVSASTR